MSGYDPRDDIPRGGVKSREVGNTVVVRSGFCAVPVFVGWSSSEGTALYSHLTRSISWWDFPERRQSRRNESPSDL